MFRRLPSAAKALDDAITAVIAGLYRLPEMSPAELAHAHTRLVQLRDGLAGMNLDALSPNLSPAELEQSINDLTPNELERIMNDVVATQPESPTDQD